MLPSFKHKPDCEAKCGNVLDDNFLWRPVLEQCSFSGHYHICLCSCGIVSNTSRCGWKDVVIAIFISHNKYLCHYRLSSINCLSVSTVTCTSTASMSPPVLMEDPVLCQRIYCSNSWIHCKPRKLKEEDHIKRGVYIFSKFHLLRNLILICLKKWLARFF